MINPRPPCWPEALPCPNICAAALHDRTVFNKGPLYGPWAGWRLAGRVLVSPDGDRISPERLRGILFQEAARARLQRAATNSAKVVPWRTPAL